MLDSSQTWTADSSHSEDELAPDRRFRPADAREGDSARWVVVSTTFGNEICARRGIRSLGLPVWLPQMGTLTDDALRPLFPGYLFAQIDGAESGWKAIYRTAGVRTILGTYERPTPIPGLVMDFLFARSGADGVLRPPSRLPPADMAPIARGAGVTIMGDGPFAHLSGICEFSSKKRVEILLHILGGSTKVTVPRHLVIESRPAP